MQTTEKQEGLNDILRKRLTDRIQRGSANGQAALSRLISEGKVAADYLVPVGLSQRLTGETPDLTFSSNGSVTMAIPSGDYHISEHALVQLGERFGVPVGYLWKLFSGTPENKALASRILNDHTGWASRDKILVRSVADSVRGVLSDSYRRLDSQKIVQGYIENVYNNGAIICDGYMSDSKLNIEALIPEPITIPTLKNGDTAIAFGVAFRNSDYGDGALELRSFLMSGVCLNGMVRESLLREVHLGKKLPDNLMLSQEAYDSDSHTQSLIVRDFTNQLLNRDTIEKRIAEIQRASMVDVDPEFELKQLLKASKISVMEFQEVEKLYMRSSADDGMNGESTLWKLTQGITAYARVASEKRSRELQQLAGELLIRV